MTNQQLEREVWNKLRKADNELLQLTKKRNDLAIEHQRIQLVIKEEDREYRKLSEGNG